MLRARNIGLTRIHYAELKGLSFDQMKSNIIEIDFSHNIFPTENLNLFFAFLFSQKCLYHVSFENVKSHSDTTFLSYLVQLVSKLPLYGLDLSGTFDFGYFGSFLHEICKCIHLLRLKLSLTSRFSFHVLQTLQSAIGNLRKLIEFGFDNSINDPPPELRPESTENFLKVWTTVLSFRKLISIEVPDNDINSVSDDFSDDSSQFQQIREKMTLLKPLSSFLQRLHYFSSQSEKKIAFDKNSVANLLPTIISLPLDQIRQYHLDFD